MLAVSFLAALPLAGAPLAAVGDEPTGPLTAIRAEVLHLGDGRHIEDGVLILREGKIEAVGKIEVPKDALLIEHDGHLAPGFVAAHSTLVSAAERGDSTRAFLEGAQVRYGFDPDRRAVRDALAAGVTSAVLSPSDFNVVGGQTAVVKTHGSNWLNEQAHLFVSLNSNSANTLRYPTSYQAALSEFATRLEAGEGVYGEVAQGQRPVLLAAYDKQEAVRAAALAQAFGLKAQLVGTDLAGEMLESLEGSGLGLVHSGLAPGATRRSREALAAVANSDLPLAFALTDPATFRMGAVLATRAGGSPDRLLTALCHGGAKSAGVGGRVGRLAGGFDADFVLWSGHPLDLTSRIEAVYVDGQLAHGGAQ
jgi:imidazolonepropionase-like amidohydrolase